MNELDSNQQSKLKKLLPSYKTKITSFSNERQGFVAVIRVNISTKVEATEWLKQFSEKSCCTFKVDRTYPENSQKIVYKKEFRCLHNTRPSSHNVKKPNSRHTGCNAKLTITVKQSSLKRSKDVYLKEYPAEIFIRHTHNHLIPSTDLPLPRRKSLSLLVKSTLDNVSPGHNNDPDDWYGFVNNKQVIQVEYCGTPEKIPNETDSTSNTNSTKQVQNLAELSTKIDKLCETLKEYVVQKPETFYKPVNAFVNNLSALKTESVFVNALCSFGKCVGVVKLPGVKVKKKLRRKIKTQKPISSLNNDHMYSASVDIQ